MYDVDRGAILINGINIADMKQQSLRRHIGIVPQDVRMHIAQMNEHRNTDVSCMTYFSGNFRLFCSIIQLPIILPTVPWITMLRWIK
jgi:ABC-type multidrug transport system ATPase subunit